MRRVWLFLACLVYAVGAIGQTGTVQGHSFLGGTKAVTSGLSSTNYLNGIIPSATITVYLTGTQNKATIFSDGSGHSLANPFTSNAVGGVNPGGYIFWAATGQGYDVVAQGGIAPNTYPQPVTLLVDVFPGGGGGGSGGCGPLPSDATSTNCGNGNFTGLTGSTGANQAFGYLNIDTNTGSSEITAAGHDNALNLTGVDAEVAIGLSTGKTNTNGGSVVAIGQDAGNGFDSTTPTIFDVVAIGDGPASKLGTVDDIIAIGDGAANTLPSTSADIVAIGDGAMKQCVTATGCSSIPDPVAVNDVVAIGDGPATFNQGHDVIAIGNQAMGSNAVGAGVGVFNTGNFNTAIGSFALVANTTGANNVALGPYAGADGYTGGTTFGNSNKTGSNNTWVGYDSGPNTTTQLTNTIALGYQAHNTASNQTTLGNSSITSLKLFGCPTGQTAFDDGSGTCYVPGTGGSGGTNVSVNGGSALTTANFNGTTPAAGTNGINLTWQISSANVSAELVGDGIATHFLDGTGNWSTPAGGGSVSLTSPSGSLTLSPSTITNTGTLDLNLSNPNTWSGTQTFAGVIFGGITGSTQCLQVNGSGVLSGSGGSCSSSPVWSSITNPTTNLALTMAANTTTFTYGAATSTPDMMKWTDTASNTGTGILAHFTTASGSTEIPWQADANGVGWQITAAGILKGVGTSAAHGITFPEGTTIGGPTAGVDFLYADSTAHCIEYSANGGAYACLNTGGGGSGTVTSFSAGVLSPLFTTSVATATTTPALTFSLSTQTANTIFAGPTSGSAAAPTFRTLVAADLPALPLYLNWTFNSGAPATDAAPRFLASHTATISTCYALTTASDGSTALTFNIFDNGTTIFSAGAQTISAATSPGTLTTLGSLATTSITNNDKFSINITSGTGSWVFTVQCK